MAISVDSGVWAMMPDFWRLSPIYEHAFRDLGHSVFGNVFWFYLLFDAADTSNSYQLAAVMVGVYFFVGMIHAE
ncbi:hypothetical protein [Halorubrum ezzemoulense]|nr:hypothetical protein [Halorubrum ezzemoulense]